MFCDKIYVLGNASGFAQIPRNLLRFIHKSLQKKNCTKVGKKNCVKITQIMRKKYGHFVETLVFGFKTMHLFWV